MPTEPCSLARRRARARISLGLKAGESSINKGASESICTAEVTLGQSSSSNLPVLIIFCSIYNPAAFPLATSALIAADHAPLPLDSSLSLASSII